MSSLKKTIAKLEDFKLYINLEMMRQATRKKLRLFQLYLYKLCLLEGIKNGSKLRSSLNARVTGAGIKAQLAGL